MASTTDSFTTLFGTARGGGRPASEDPEIISIARRRRLTLALIAGHGILGHNSAVSMPGRFGAGRIAALVEHGGQPNLPDRSPVTDELLDDLRALTSARLLYYGFDDEWSVTPAGLVALWTGLEI